MERGHGEPVGKEKKKLNQIEKNESTTSYKWSLRWCRCSVLCFSSDYYWISDSVTIFSFYSVAETNDANSSISDSQRGVYFFFSWIIIANAHINWSIWNMLSEKLLSFIKSLWCNFSGRGNSQSSLNYTIIIENFGLFGEQSLPLFYALSPYLLLNALTQYALHIANQLVTYGPLLLTDL